MSDEALEEEWHGLLSLVVPNFEHVILTTSEHVVRIQTDVNACDSSSMTVGYLSEQYTLVFEETEEFNLAILSNYEQISVVIGKLERLNDVVNHDLVMDQK